MKREMKMNEKGTRPLPYLRNERGMVLVLTMVIFLVLTSVAATNIINAYLERSLANNQHYATIALNAADSGIDHGIAWLVENPGSIDYANPTTWQQTLTGALDNGGSYAVTIRFARDEQDLDQQGDFDDIIYYNNCGPSDGCFNFNEAVYDFANTNPVAPPFPVIEIAATGDYGGAGRRVVSLNVARNGLDVQSFGAITAGGDVRITGTPNIIGNGHDENGNLCNPGDPGDTCTSDCTDEGYPGVTVDDGKAVDWDGNSADGSGGDPTIDGEIGAIPGSPTMPRTVDEALGLPEGSLVGMFGGSFPPLGSSATMSNVTYVHGDYALPGSGEGVLIVSNPLFNARAFDVSTTGEPGYYNLQAGDDCATSTFSNPNYDPVLDDGNQCGVYDSDYRDARQPAKFEAHGNSTWKGVIIADRVDKINGDISIYGTVISLTTLFTDISSNGTPDIFYSCDAVKTYGAMPYATKLSWHRRF